MMYLELVGRVGSGPYWVCQPNGVGSSGRVPVENIESGQQVRWVYACDGSGVDLSAAATVVHIGNNDMVRIRVAKPSGEVLETIHYGYTLHGTVVDPMYDLVSVTFNVDRRSLVPTHQWARVASFGWLD